MKTIDLDAMFPVREERPAAREERSDVEIRILDTLCDINDRLWDAEGKKDELVQRLQEHLTAMDVMSAAKELENIDTIISENKLLRAYCRYFLGFQRDTDAR